MRFDWDSLSTNERETAMKCRTWIICITILALSFMAQTFIGCWAEQHPVTLQMAPMQQQGSHKVLGDDDCCMLSHTRTIKNARVAGTFP